MSEQSVMRGEARPDSQPSDLSGELTAPGVSGETCTQCLRGARAMHNAPLRHMRAAGRTRSQRPLETTRDRKARTCSGQSGRRRPDEATPRAKAIPRGSAGTWGNYVSKIRILSKLRSSGPSRTPVHAHVCRSGALRGRPRSPMKRKYTKYYKNQGKTHSGRGGDRGEG